MIYRGDRREMVFIDPEAFEPHSGYKRQEMFKGR
jgi:hypothetical protein